MAKQIMVLLVTLLMCVGCNPDHYQSGTEVERKHLFDYDWKFALGDHAAAGKDFNDDNWQTLDLPHDWSIKGNIEHNNPTSGEGGYFPAGIGWYRKTLKIPSAWQGKRIAIYFEGVYMNAQVFLNGHQIGEHPYGYTSFYFDLTPHLEYDAENVLSVRVDNSQQTNCRWYSGSGLYRHVWLWVTDPVHIGHWGVAITTPEVSPEKATVQLSTVVKNTTEDSQSVALSIQLWDQNNKPVGNNQVQIELGPKSENKVIRKITVKQPKLWSPDTPVLYRAQMAVKRDGDIIDMAHHRFGIRSIQFSAENGFLLNGKSVILNGGCVHHDNGCLGAAAFDRAEERKVELLKAAGFNAVRTAHNPPSEAFLTACDKLGLLVMDESFDGWRQNKTPYDYANYFDNWWQRDLQSMVLRDRNHPSIIMWSTGNEILERTEPEAITTAEKLANCVRQYDPTRPVTSAMTTWDQGWEIFDPLFAVHDVGGYNYQLHRATTDHKRVPTRVIVNTESYPRNAFFIWDLVQKNKYIIGDFVWTALDYLGESGIGRYYYPGENGAEHWQDDLFPWHGAYCGDIDLTGWRKPISHYRDLLYNNTEKIYMAVREPNPESGEIKLTQWAVWPTWESWTWPGYEGRDVQVEVYSKYPSVRLYLDEQLIGEKPTTRAQEFKATFTLPYTPGQLKAVAVKDQKEHESTVLNTAGKADHIRLLPDRSEITANGQDLSFVTIEITDKDGNVQPNAANRLQFQLDGPGVIAGVDNAKLNDLDPYYGESRNAWHGRALVVIKSTRTAGLVTLTVKSEALPDAVATIKAN